MDFPLGWVAYEERTDEQNAAHEASLAKMPAFDLPPQGTPEKGTKILLSDTWKHARVRKALGMDFPGWHQFTGSCVGVGGGNAAQTCSFLDVLMRGDSELLLMLFWPYNYGRSRQLGGMRGRGEGSFGSTFAQSMAEDGVVGWLPELDLPTFKVAGQLDIGKAAELEWSDGSRASQAIRQAAKPRKITSAPVGTGEGVRDAILNGYCCTRAFGTFVNPGSAQVRDGVLIGSYNGRGGHQESWLGYWHHPNRGELILEMNQWGQDVYGIDPAGGPAGSCWVPIEECDRQCRNGEIYALSQYDGYPAQPEVFDWLKQSLWS